MLQNLKEEVYRANLSLVEHKLVKLTFGNASGIDRKTGFMVIKPSGISMRDSGPDDMVVTDLSCNVVEGDLLPSTDAPTHAALYKAFGTIGGIVHTHSASATAWAQACRPIPCLGTTHADYFHGNVPVTRSLTREEIAGNYEYNTALVIVECFREMDPLRIPAVLVASHGPFTWGGDVTQAVLHAISLEEIARTAALTLSIAPVGPIDQTLLDKHFFRKHGQGAYYGQKK
ncbi:MAG TPA: L-ribulose-5-phosphate 4-epimerase AraD [Bacteroidales bacterium]|nr:L-ribulose-5-phosphate 4-epimerase AraD [Bacteroidales bacterium]HNR40981.1 L-ribulose-5-phosphate 4-epimerase AraD [Bacteroidales bacterium]HPM18154.1 L-ribulose-5-phosphate 4-epimerase AraD [Bacteroidales bacterium]